MSLQDKLLRKLRWVTGLVSQFFVLHCITWSRTTHNSYLHCHCTVYQPFNNFIVTIFETLSLTSHVQSFFIYFYKPLSWISRLIIHPSLPRLKKLQVAEKITKCCTAFVFSSTCLATVLQHKFLRKLHSVTELFSYFPSFPHNLQ